MILTFPGALFLVFLVLKLTGNIDWSWLWVTFPLWIPLALAFVKGFLEGLKDASRSGSSKWDDAMFDRWEDT